MNAPMAGGSPEARAFGLGVVVFLLLSALPATASAAQTARPLLASHAPIFIGSDANFTAANGVTGGTGTVADPYIIEGWDIGAQGADGLILRYTTAHVILRNLFVHDGGPTYSGVLILFASNVTVDSSNWTRPDAAYRSPCGDLLLEEG
jgi:hypothetical protein